MSAAEIRIELIKKIVRDWALSDECGGVDALIAIMEVLDYNPYEQQRELLEARATAHTSNHHGEVR